MEENKDKKENNEKKEKKEVQAKAILIGDSFVGKTSLIRVATGEDFNDMMKRTLAASCTEKKIKIGSLNYSVNLWDTAGQELYSKLNGIFYKSSDIVILVYDVTKQESFNNLEKWIQNLEENTNSEAKYVWGVVGNKKDLFEDQIITEKMGMDFAKSKEMKFKMVSAKTDPLSFNKFLEELVKDAKDNLLNKKENISLKNYNKKLKDKCKC